jgi:hypothetical protein
MSALTATDPDARHGAQVAWEVRAVTRKEVIVKAIEGRPTWSAAADILGITPRHMRRLRVLYEQCGYDGLVDQRGGTPRHKPIPLATIRTLCRLRRDRFADFSIQHAWSRPRKSTGCGPRTRGRAWCCRPRSSRPRHRAAAATGAGGSGAQWSECFAPTTRLEDRPSPKGVGPSRGVSHSWERPRGSSRDLALRRWYAGCSGSRS